MVVTGKSSVIVVQRQRQTSRCSQLALRRRGRSMAALTSYGASDIRHRSLLVCR